MTNEYFSSRVLFICFGDDKVKNISLAKYSTNHMTNEYFSPEFCSFVLVMIK